VVHGADGLDELSTTGYTKVSECRDGAVHTFYVNPAEFGLQRAKAGSLSGGDAVENARIVRGVLEGKAGPARDVVVYNAGASLLVAGHASTVQDGLGMAEAAIDSGAARATLDRMARLSHEGGPA
jgi:anthranilate phosphoribosyltransferase